MTEKTDIIRRLKLGQSIRSIHKETGIHRTLIRDIKTLAESRDWLNEDTPLPDENELQELLNKPKEIHQHPLDTIKDKIKEWVDQEYSYVVIHNLTQDYVSCSESTVRRYIQRNYPPKITHVTPRTTKPGIMEVDFGYFGITYDPVERRNRKTYVFSARLRHSRLAYRESVFDQKQETFFRCHIHAFEYFQAVPAKVVPDNLKAAVIQTSFEDPLINRMYINLARHYGFLISPCLPYSPKHKGGVENDIKYIKRNFRPLFLEKEKQKGREIPDAHELAKELKTWSENTANTRTIKGVGRSPVDIFDTEEKEHLLPLPAARWDPLEGGLHKVHETGRIQFKNAYYSIPYQYIGQKMLVLANSKTLWVFDKEYKEVTQHERTHQKWGFQLKKEHQTPEMEKYLEATRERILHTAKQVGSSFWIVMNSIITRKCVDGLRPARALLRLAKQYGKERAERASQRALFYDNPEYICVKNILQKKLDFMDVDMPVDSMGQRYFRFARPDGFFNPGNH